jgi:hypothetical protein
MSRARDELNRDGSRASLFQEALKGNAVRRPAPNRQFQLTVSVTVVLAVILPVAASVPVTVIV